MIGETREAIEAYCVAVGLVVYEWNDLHEKLARLFALVREGGRREALAECDAIRSDTKQREKLRCAIIETTSGRWKKSPRAPGDLNWLLDRADKLASDRNNAIHAPCSLYLRGDGSSEMMAAVRSANAGNRRAKVLRERTFLPSSTGAPHMRCVSASLPECSRPRWPPRTATNGPRDQKFHLGRTSLE
jgi:hypothetical protein